MQITKSDKKTVCIFCKQDADFISDGEKPVALCKDCALQMYKQLAKEFVPQAIPNIIKKAEDNTTASKSTLEKGLEILDENEILDINDGKTEDTTLEKAVKTGGIIASFVLKIIDFFKHIFQK